MGAMEEMTKSLGNLKGRQKEYSDRVHGLQLIEGWWWTPRNSSLDPINLRSQRIPQSRSSGNGRKSGHSYAKWRPRPGYWAWAGRKEGRASGLDTPKSGNGRSVRDHQYVLW